MPEQAVIFDMDGVLVDSYRAHFESWRRVARRLGREMTEEEFASVFGRTNPDIFEALWPGVVPADEVDHWSDTKEAAYREILLADFPAMGGAAELIAALKAAGFRLAVGSSGPPENVACAVEGLALPDAFDAVVHGKDVSRGKPDPEVFLRCAERLGVGLDSCAVIEDACPGVEAARRAGMVPVALTGTAPRERLAASGAMLVVDSLWELSPALLAGLIGGRRPA